LRSDLDFMASPFPERPGLLIRDPHRYSDATLIVPPALVSCLGCFDGTKSEVDLRDVLLLSTGLDIVTEIATDLVRTLREAGMLDDQMFALLKSDRHRQFQQAPHRTAVHSGAGYPDEPAALGRMLTDVVSAGGKPAREALIGVAAPHVSPEGGWRSYRAAYAALGAVDGERTFVILGTSHYGEPERFGLTRKPFLTPFGETAIDTDLVDELAEGGGPGAMLEDYCHSVEHSIEFQVVFLQHLFGPAIRIVPVLCGPFARSTAGAGRPEDDEGVRRFLGTLGEVAAREGRRLLFVLGVDMAHVGRRYGDGGSARVGDEAMARVEARDRARIDRIAAGSAADFWGLVQEKRDDLRWCGASPLYTFLHAVRPPRGALLRYEQWNIDEHSVVSFAGLAFREQPAAS